jgi:hypothetical protein
MKLSLLTHSFNEKLLLPAWLNHHSKIFDEIVIIDHATTDGSMDWVRENYPEVKITPTSLSDFNATLNDQECMKHEEETLTGDWKMILNITEFMFTPHLREVIKQNEDVEALGFRAYFLVDKELNQPLETPIFKGRTHGFLDPGGVLASRNWRYIHRAPNGRYSCGRHSTHLTHRESFDWNILFFSMSPWPQAVERKLQVQIRIPLIDKQGGLGIQHIQTPESLDRAYKDLLGSSGDLLLDERFKKYYDHYINESLD